MDTTKRPFASRVRQLPENLTSTQAIGMLAIQGFVLTLAGLGLWMWSGREIVAILSVSWQQIMIGLGFGGALIIVVATAFRLFPKANDYLVRLQSDTYRFLGRDLGWPAIVAISLIAGISEEVALRAGLQTIIGDALGVPAAIAIASALFAAMHLAKPLILLLLLVIGVLFGVVYWLSGSLLAVMIAHVIYDIWALRYLNRAMHRLNLFDDPASLANQATPG